MTETVPAWDGNARGWRRYQREVMWYWLGTKKRAAEAFGAAFGCSFDGPSKTFGYVLELSGTGGTQGCGESHLQVAGLTIGPQEAS